MTSQIPHQLWNFLAIKKENQKEDAEEETLPESRLASPLDQWEARILVRWSVSTNQSPESGLASSHYPDISAGQQLGDPLDQSEASIGVSWSLSTNQRPGERLRDGRVRSN